MGMNSIEEGQVAGVDSQFQHQLAESTKAATGSELPTRRPRLLLDPELGGLDTTGAEDEGEAAGAELATVIMVVGLADGSWMKAPPWFVPASEEGAGSLLVGGAGLLLGGAGLLLVGGAGDGDTTTASFAGAPGVGDGAGAAAGLKVEDMTATDGASVGAGSPTVSIPIVSPPGQ